MDRKIFFVVLVLALAVTILAEAQQPNKIYRIGVLTIGESRASRIQAFRQSMKELGYSEGKDFVLEIRRADEKGDQHPKLAAELVGLPVDVIVSDSTALTTAAKNATRQSRLLCKPAIQLAWGSSPALRVPAGTSQD
jgi:putative tryptophan/tyrosine transport system substrate-binding protein